MFAAEQSTSRPKSSVRRHRAGARHAGESDLTRRSSGAVVGALPARGRGDDGGADGARHSGPERVPAGARHGRAGRAKPGDAARLYRRVRRPRADRARPRAGRVPAAARRPDRSGGALKPSCMSDPTGFRGLPTIADLHPMSRTAGDDSPRAGCSTCGGRIPSAERRGYRCPPCRPLSRPAEPGTELVQLASLRSLAKGLSPSQVCIALAS